MAYLPCSNIQREAESEERKRECGGKRDEREKRKGMKKSEGEIKSTTVKQIKITKTKRIIY